MILQRVHSPPYETCLPNFAPSHHNPQIFPKCHSRNPSNNKSNKTNNTAKKMAEDNPIPDSIDNNSNDDNVKVADSHELRLLLLSSTRVKPVEFLPELPPNHGDHSVTGLDWSKIRRSETHSTNLGRFQRITPRFNCSHCSYNGGPVSLLDQEYYKKMCEHNVCWEHNLVQFFSVLIAHCYGHYSRFYFVMSHTQEDQDGTPTSVSRQIPNFVTSVVTIAWAENHFVLLIFDLEHHTVLVRDGLRMDLSVWVFQIENIIATYNLQPENSPDWTSKHDLTGFIEQHDCVNCGPLACFQLFRLYQPEVAQAVLNRKQTATIDKFTVPQMRKFMLNMLTPLIRHNVHTLSHGSSLLVARPAQDQTVYDVDLADTDLSALPAPEVPSAAPPTAPHPPSSSNSPAIEDIADPTAKDAIASQGQNNLPETPEPQPEIPPTDVFVIQQETQSLQSQCNVSGDMVDPDADPENQRGINGVVFLGVRNGEIPDFSRYDFIVKIEDVGEDGVKNGNQKATPQSKVITENTTGDTDEQDASKANTIGLSEGTSRMPPDDSDNELVVCTGHFHIDIQNASESLRG